MTVESNVVGIIGVGHVGSQVVRLFGDAGWSVVAYDTKTDQQYPADDFEKAALIVVCVNTPSGADGQDCCHLRSALSELSRPKLVAIRSTVLPGTTDALAAEFGYPMVHWPEYYGETAYANHFWPNSAAEIPFTVIGGPEPLVRRMFDYLSPIYGPNHQLHGCTAVEAELVKYMENAFLAAKVTFVNEFYDLANQLGANWYRVREGWLLDPRVGRSHTAVFPDDRGFGGRCLPKDMEALVRWAADRGVDMPMVRAVKESNDRHRDLTE